MALHGTACVCVCVCPRRRRRERTYLYILRDGQTSERKPQPERRDLAGTAPANCPCQPSLHCLHPTVGGVPSSLERRPVPSPDVCPLETQRDTTWRERRKQAPCCPFAERRRVDQATAPAVLCRKRDGGVCVVYAVPRYHGGVHQMTITRQQKVKRVSQENCGLHKRSNIIFPLLVLDSFRFVSKKSHMCIAMYTSVECRLHSPAASQSLFPLLAS